MLSAPGSICPYCLVGVVANLDHWLPKKSFPSYAVSPINLIPSCRDCNTRKGRKVTTLQRDQIFHPYYDELPNEKWLEATISRTQPLTITFHANPPATWSVVHQGIVRAHFLRFKLGVLYAIQAGTELGNLRESLVTIYQSTGEDGVSKFLNLLAESRRLASLNSWQTALYEALAMDYWFISGGFNDIAAP